MTYRALQFLIIDNAIPRPKITIQLRTKQKQFDVSASVLQLDKQTLCVSMQEMEIWAEKHGFRICLTAAMDGRGVSEICPVRMRWFQMLLSMSSSTVSQCLLLVPIPPYMSLKSQPLEK